jgi:metal-sulfur cluster biosynthetic enzyme
MKTIDKDEISKKVIEKLKTIQDLELPINIYNLGIIYKTNVEYKSDKIHVTIEMTMINSRCNSTKSFTDEIISVVKSIDEVDECDVKFVFSPKWEVTMISDEGLEQLRNVDSK